MEKEVTRRDALKLAAGAAALGAALGVPRSALAAAARGEPAYEFYFKLFFSGKLWQSVLLTEEQAKALAENPGALTLKLTKDGNQELGSMGLTPEVQLKLRSFLKGGR